MKKFILLAMIVLGTSLAQAQDITIRIVTNNSSEKIAVGVDDTSLCFDNVTIVKTDVYGWNNTSGILTLNGETLQTYAGFTKVGTNNFFNSYETTFYNSNFLNAVRGEASYGDNGNGTYTSN